jgi:hypothetical protein
MVSRSGQCTARGEDYGQACELTLGHKGRHVDVFGGTFGNTQVPQRCTARAETPGGWSSCTLPAGHAAMHVDSRGMRWDEDETPLLPRRCGQRLVTPFAGTELVCTLLAGHRGTFHRADDGSTWSRAGDLQGPPSLQHDACGARLTVDWSPDSFLAAPPSPASWVCALGPHDANEQHRAADGTQWRASDFPPTAPTAFQSATVIRSAVAGISDQIDRMTEVFGELREAVDSGLMNRVRAALRAAGVEDIPVLTAIGDLVGQRDGHAEHAKNAENALLRIADMARQALGPDGHGQLASALLRIIAVTEESDR